MSIVLVVDDVKAMREHYAYDLRRLGGYETITASDGKQALLLLQNEPIDCVILDLEMPGADGFEVLKVLGEQGSKVPVIVYTGTGDYDRCVRAVKLGAYSFISKTETTERVVQEVENALQTTRLSRQVADLNRRHGNPLTPGQERQLIALLRGHPYLTRRALYMVASQRISAPDLFVRATEDRGPFGDHLRNHFFRMHDKEDLLKGLHQVLSDGTCPDERVLFGLRGAGLVRREGKAVLARCQLYADYFRERIRG